MPCGMQAAQVGHGFQSLTDSLRFNRVCGFIVGMDGIPQTVQRIPEGNPGDIPVATEGNPQGNPGGQGDTPSSVPRGTPKRKDKRPTLTLKGEEFGPEFRALINKAAERAGMTQSAFVAETLTREAQRIIKGTPQDTPTDTPSPPALNTARLDEQDRRLAEIAAAVHRLTELQQRTLWQRLRAMFKPVAATSDL
jgi:hypothetical protein